MKDERKERTARQEMAETNPQKMEPNPGKMVPGTERREVPTEEVIVKSSGKVMKRHRSRHLAAGQH
jgi:hypothetical protein